MWRFQLSLLWMLTPKYFADSTISQDVSLDGIGMLYQQLSLVAYLKDLAFLGGPHEQVIFPLLDGLARKESHWRTVLLYSGRSLIYRRKSVGPRILPWGTPDRTGTESDLVNYVNKQVNDTRFVFIMFFIKTFIYC